jgi:hypothetical protein
VYTIFARGLYPDFTRSLAKGSQMASSRNPKVFFLFSQISQGAAARFHKTLFFFTRK